MKFAFAFAFLISSLTFADSDHMHGLKKREYYEYDTLGTRGDKIKRKLRHGTAKTITSPYRAIRKGYRGTRNLLRSVKRNTEVFLTDAGSVHGRREHLHDVLTGWENSEDLKSIIKRERSKSERFLFGIPHDAWILLKDTLYAAGYRLPRAGWHALRALVMGYKNLAGI